MYRAGQVNRNTGGCTPHIRNSSARSLVPVRFFTLSSLCRLVVFLAALALTACASVQKPLTGLVPGRQLETLQSSVSLSLKAGEHGTSGRGYLVFSYPDRFHIAVLSPFGLTVLEIFSDGDRLTCIVPSRQTAYQGRASELPANGVFRSFALFKWVVAHQADPDPSQYGSEVLNASGDRVHYDKFGLMDRKISPGGDRADFHDYRNVSGVPFPEAIEIRTGPTSARIVFDEPEINTEIEPAALTPNLEGYSIRPLDEFKGV
ncbi:outer-membrane lipoprotein LolB [Geomonas silvestris]|uniref:Outer-membrane lipoprotein LolB n=1 Tax=Geomonas silvestris TaxID=2740184 RepID=A0A6V8MJA9_9BACT|nr:outer-membrane lipoprotein LolB [Geomonas silvestris]